MVSMSSHIRFGGNYVNSCVDTPAEEAQSKGAGLGDNAVHQKYVELVRRIYPLAYTPLTTANE